MRERFRVVGGARLVGEVAVVGRQEQRPQAHGRGPARRGPDHPDERAGHRRRDDHGRAAAATRRRRRLRPRRRDSSCSTSPSRSGIVPTTSSSGRCAPRSRCSARSSPGSARPTSPCRVVTRSAPAVSTCMRRASRRSAPTVHVTHGYLVAKAPARPQGRGHPARLPQRRRDREHPHGRRPRPGHDDDRQRRQGARDRRHRRDAHRRWALASRAQAPPASSSTASTPCTRPSTAVLPDRVAAGTWAFAAATTRGDIEVVGGVAEHLRSPLQSLAAAGCHVEVTARGFRVAVPERAGRPRRSTSRPCRIRVFRPTCSHSR